MDLFPPPGWTMNTNNNKNNTTSLSRKRSRLALESDEEAQQPAQSAPTPATHDNTLKRSRTQCELDELAIVDAEQAWSVDVDAILASRCIAAPTGGSRWEKHDNMERYSRGTSTIVLCVQGNVQVHYQLLWYAV